MRKYICILSVVLGLLAATSVLAGQPWEVGQPAPEITIKNFDTGQDFELAKELKKGAILIEWFSSTCASCRQEAIALREAAKQGTLPKDAKIYFLSIDFNDLGLASYKKEHQLESFTVLHDPKYVSAPKFGFRTTPATVVIDKAGNIAFRQSGYGGNIKEILEALDKAAK